MFTLIFVLFLVSSTQDICRSREPPPQLTEQGPQSLVCHLRKKLFYLIFQTWYPSKVNALKEWWNHKLLTNLSKITESIIRDKLTEWKEEAKTAQQFRGIKSQIKMQHHASREENYKCLLWWAIMAIALDDWSVRLLRIVAKLFLYFYTRQNILTNWPRHFVS